MRKLYATVMLTWLTLLSGCMGHSDGNDEQETIRASVSTLSILLEDSTGDNKLSYQSNETITVTVTAYDENSLPVSGANVSLSTTLGTLSQTSKLTDEDGEAVVTITNPDNSIGAGTVTATADENSTNKDFEYLANSNGEGLPPSLSSEMRLNGVVVNQFKNDEQVQIIATLVDTNNQPIANEIITFTADIGSLNTTTGLTNAQGTAAVTLNGDGDIGAGVASASLLNEEEVISSSRINYEVIDADAVIVDDTVRVGYFNENNEFIDGKIKLSIEGNEISAGGTLGLTVDLVDSNDVRINAPTPVTFNSNCVQSGNATVDQSVFTINGTAQATYEDIDCAGLTGTDDVIIASVTVNNITTTADETISISGEQLGSIEFISAEPTSIVLKGTGGQGKQETSTLTYLVKSSLDNPLAQQEVDFSLDTTVGGITISPTVGLTNSQGLVTTKVTAGTVPTAVRVTAKASMTINNEDVSVQTQSDLLSINTGLPEQRSFTLSAEVYNPEADNINGVEVTIVAQLADNFNNPVPDGTTVNFTTEGGAIQPSCTTVNGACTVVWTSAEPRVPDHRITILATALGHETFFDTNGNNTFDDNDGDAIENMSVSSGFGRENAQPSGFVDMTEAWRDDNENLTHDSGEIFLDYNSDSNFSAEDAKFNGPQCEGSKCADSDLQATHVRKAIIMDMASSSALYSLEDASSGTVFANNSTGTNNDIPDIIDATGIGFSLYIADTAHQAMPLDTSVTVESSVGDLQGTTSFTVPNGLSPSTIGFSIFNTLGGDPENGLLTIRITSPSGVVTTVQKNINLL